MTIPENVNWEGGSWKARLFVTISFMHLASNIISENNAERSVSELKSYISGIQEVFYNFLLISIEFIC